MITMLGGMRGVGGQRVAPSKITTGFDTLIDHAQAIFDAALDPEAAATAMESIILYRSIIQHIIEQEGTDAGFETLINYIQTILGPGALPHAVEAGMGSSITHIQTAYGPGQLGQAVDASFNSIILYEPA